MTDTLDKLKKAFQQAISTSATTQSSNELLIRREAIQSGQAFGSPIVPGGMGAWVGSAGFPYTGTDDLGLQLGTGLPVRNSIEMGLGLPGVPDVDFVPYAWNTNRFGGKGPALLGHPISWEVVGPTLKSPYCDWQWLVDLGANTLTLEDGPNPLIIPKPTVAEAYNFSATFEDEGGLYVLLSFTGEGYTGALAAPRTAIPTATGKDHRAPFELFRVLTVVGQVITLRSEKLMSSYFDAGTGCRAITVIRPKVTRLAPLPAVKSGGGQLNRTFVFVPPETSARSEYMPPYSGGAGQGTWLAGGFDSSGSISEGETTDWGGSQALPIPKPFGEQQGYISGVPDFGKAGQWRLEFAQSLPAAVVVGTVIRVHNLRVAGATFLSGGEGGSGGLPGTAFGFFEIVNLNPGPPDEATLRRAPEIDPDTGYVYYGDGPYASDSGAAVWVQFFQPISTLFSDVSLNLGKLSAARLQNLIDPRTAGPSITGRDGSGVSQVPSVMPDRAIFNTRPGEDPGNLLDLGFRSVFFPAKIFGGVAVPDFDNPIDTEGVVVNTSVNTRQYIEVDYSAGVAYLSEEPLPSGTRCDVVPDLATYAAPNNPRSEIVLYAACVPYSMEEGQTGGGVRVMSSSLDSVGAGFGTSDLADVFGRRIITQPDVVQVLTPAALATVTTAIPDTNITDIPSCGFFFLVDSPAGVLGNRRGPYYYQLSMIGGGIVSLFGVSGPAGATTLDPGPGVNTQIIIQRSIRAFSPILTNSDTVRGSSKRVNTLAFKGGDVSFNADGSVSVDVQQTLQKAYDGGNTILTPVNLNPVTITDGVDTTTLAASSVSSLDFLYSVAQTRLIVIPVLDGISRTAAGVPDWAFSFPGGTFPHWTSVIAASEVLFPLPVPNNCSIVNVLVVVTPISVGLAAGNRIQAEVYSFDHDFTTPANPTGGPQWAECDDSTGLIQTLDLKTHPNIGGAPGATLVVASTSGTKEWFLRIRSSTAVGNDIIASIQLQLQLNKPAQW
jgi:hypothetical protein